MANIVELRRVIDIRGKTTGVKEAAADLKKLDNAYAGVTVESVKTEKATLSMDRQLAALQRRIDPTFRATERLAQAERTLNAAQAQGLITMARKNELLGLAAVKSDAATAATGRLAGATRMLSGLFAGFGIGIGFTALTQLPRIIGDIVNEAGDLVDTADKIGISTRALQELKFAGAQSGVEFSELSSGLSFFNKSIGEASRGGGDLLKILKANGIALRDQAGQLRDPISLLHDYADLVQNAASAQDQATLVTKAFGRANDELIIALANGSAGLRAMAEDADRSGLILEDGLLRRTEELGDRWDKFTTRLSTAFKNFVLTVVDGADAVTGAIDRVQSRLPPGTLFGGGLSSGVSSIPNFDVPGLKDLAPTGSKTVVINFEGRFNPPLERTIIPEVDKTVKAIDATLNGVKVPLPNLRPEVDNIVKSLDRAQASARGFVETLVGGLADGKGIIGSLADAVSGLTSTLGTTLGDKVSGLIGGATSGLFGNILSGLGGGIVSSLVSSIGGLIDSIFGGNDEEERLRRREERQRKREARERREDKLEAKEDARLARREATLRRRESFRDRAFMAGLDTDTLEGQLAAFDREARREREEEIRNGGKALGALEKALAAERLKIQKDFNDQAIEEAKRAADEMNRVARSIVDYVNGLNTGSDSPLSPVDRLTAAQSAYSSQLALAQGGNLEAQSTITQYADSLLKAARDFWASGPDFQAIFNQVKTDLLGLPAVGSSTDPVVNKLAEILIAQQNLLNATGTLQTAVGGVSTAVTGQNPLLTVLAKETSLTNSTKGLPGIAADVDPLKASLDKVTATMNGLNMTMVALGKYINKIADYEAKGVWKPILKVLATIASNTGKKVKPTPVAPPEDYAGYTPPTTGVRMGGLIPGFAAGGMVGNGIWDRDSVLARYAGGGSIALAGGEFVTRAPSVNAMTMPILDAINRTGRMPSNDNGRYFADQNRVLMAGFRAMIETLTAENAALRAEVARSGERMARAVRDKPVAKPATKVA